MILESIAVTADETGRINIAPMGPIVDGPQLSRFTLRPFQSSTTCKNLLATKRITLHVTDDVGLFAKAAVGRIEAESLVVQVDLPKDRNCQGSFWRLRDCHRWFALDVHEVTGGDPLYRMETTMIATGVERPFFGFNRGKHAVIEAAILATRLHLLDPNNIREQFAQLQVLVDKTACSEDATTFGWLKQHVHAKLGGEPLSPNSD